MKTRHELETIIRCSAADRTWQVFSEDPKIVRKMTRLHGPGRKVSEFGLAWEVPLACVSLRKTRVGTQAQREIGKRLGQRSREVPTDGK